MPSAEGIGQRNRRAVSDAQNADVLDAGLIGCAQAVEHYEMARYGTLRAWAEQLEMEDAAELLDETLEEEKAADEKLTGWLSPASTRALRMTATMRKMTTTRPRSPRRRGSAQASERRLGLETRQT